MLSTKCALFLLFWIVLLTDFPEADSFDLKSRLSATDQNYRNQFNDVREFIATGFLASTFGTVIRWFLGIIKFGKYMYDQLKKGWDTVKNFVNDIGNTLGLWKRGTEFVDPRDDKNRRVPDHKPVLGPSAEMNELRWNKRLSQLVYARMEMLSRDYPQTMEYNNKTYRAFQHGSFFESIAHDLFPILAGVINAIKAVWSCFKILVSDCTDPVTDEKQVHNTVFEYLFYDYVEVGCGTNWDGSWCLIGPAPNGGNVLHRGITKKGNPCDGCDECVNRGLCKAKLDHEDQARLREIMRGEVEVEEVVVEEVTIMPAELQSSGPSASFFFSFFCPLAIVLLIF